MGGRSIGDGQNQLIVPEIPGFRLKAVLGRGGVGSVYRADDRKGRDVALKVMPLEIDETRKKRFAQEASIGRLLRHPDIVRVYETGQHQNLGWISMEVLEGLELSPAMRERPFDVRERVRVIVRVAGALHHAHERGIVHRDVKPSNIFLTNDGGVKLLDFGIARLKANRITKTGFIVGTPQYMAPEQITGTNIDGRADVFSLGVVTYELLTGALPWAGDNHTQIMMAICTKPPDPFDVAFAHLRVDLPAEELQRLHRVIHKAIRQEPQHRYQDAADFSKALVAYLDGEDVASGDLAIKEGDPDAMAKRRIDWAMARAARAKVEEERVEIKAQTLDSTRESVNHFDEDVSAGGSFLWLSLLLLFTLALGVAVWLMLTTT